MSNSRIFITVVLLLSFFCLCIPDSSAKDDNKKQKIKWSPEKVEINAEDGESLSIDVQFESKKSLSNVSLWVVPELQPYISVTPSYFEEIRKGRTYSVNIDVSIPYNTEIGLYKGTIDLREIHKGKDDDGSSDDKNKWKKHHGDDDSSGHKKKK